MNVKKPTAILLSMCLSLGCLTACGDAAKLNSVADSYNQALSDVSSFRCMFDMHLNVSMSDHNTDSENSGIIQGNSSKVTTNPISVNGQVAVSGSDYHGITTTTTKGSEGESKSNDITSVAEFYVSDAASGSSCYVKSSESQLNFENDKSVKSAWQKIPSDSDSLSEFKYFVSMSKFKKVDTTLFKHAKFVARDGNNAVVLPLSDYVAAGLVPVLFGERQNDGTFDGPILNLDATNPDIVNQLKKYDVVMAFDTLTDLLNYVDIKDVKLSYHTFVGEGKDKHRVDYDISFDLHFDLSDYNKISDTELSPSEDVIKNAIDVEKESKSNSKAKLTDKQLANRTELLSGKFKYAGQDLRMPFDVSVLLDDGWSVDNPDLSVPEGKCVTDFKWKTSKYGKVHPFFGLYNSSAATAAYSDCYVYIFGIDVAVCDKDKPEIILPGGITWGATKKEVVEAYGEPSLETKGDFYTQVNYDLLNSKGDIRGSLMLYYYDKGKDVKTSGLAKVQYQIY